MKTLNTIDENTAFEAWAQLLISRKVPEHYRHFIDPEVVVEGAAILKRGEAFEVRISDGCTDASSGDAAPGDCDDTRILVAPFPDSVPQRRVHR